MSGEESEAKGNLSEYEKQRLSRIAENKARLEALGISKSAKALLGPSPSSRKRKGKRSSGEEDDDYRPDGDDDRDSEYEDEEFCRKRKLKNKTSASKRNVFSNKNSNTLDSIRDEDDDFNKAIALSLQQTPTNKKRNYDQAASCQKNKPEVKSRMQMTQDELVIHFYQFDEEGKGSITLRDLAKMATLHDFTWTQEELQDMIRCFDTDKDTKLSLDEFTKIVTRCRMLREP